MTLADIVKTVGNELGTADLKEINKLLKAEPAVKFRITGKALGHFGFTGNIKSISEEGVKAFMANKVSLIRLGDIETFEKAKPREERPVRTPKTETKSVPEKSAVAAKPAVKKAKAPSKPVDDFEDDAEDFEDDDYGDEELRPKKLKGKKTKAAGKSGSKFIPSFKK